MVPTRYSPVLAVLGLTVGSARALAEEVVYTPTDNIDWEPHSFEGETTYELVNLDGRQARARPLHQRHRVGASSSRKTWTWTKHR